MPTSINQRVLLPRIDVVVVVEACCVVQNLLPSQHLHPSQAYRCRAPIPDMFCELVCPRIGWPAASCRQQQQ
jgi:hypothetical protein